MSEQDQITSSPAAAGGMNRTLIIGGIAALGIVALAVIGAIILIPRLLGADKNAIAGVMPPDTAVLVEVNALNLANEDASRVARAFEDVLDENNVQFKADNPGRLLEDLDDQLDEASGLTITDDILPWIGPNLGIGLIELDIEAMNSGEVPKLIFATTIRDTAVADQFIENLIDAIEDNSPNKVQEVEYGGALVFEIDSDFDDERLAFGRSAEIFFLAANIDILEEAIDAQNGENLGGVEEYKNTIAQLPGDRALTVYVSGGAVEDGFKAAEDSGEFSGFDSRIVDDLGLKGAGMAATIIAEGIRVDFVSNFDSLTEEQQALMDAQTDNIKTADFLPESTYVFLVAQRLDLVWQSALDALDQAGVSEADLDEAMDLFDDSFGFNPSKDLFPLLDGEYSVALIDSDEGAIAQEFSTDIGVVMMVGSSDGEELAKLAEDFTDGLKDQDLNVDDSSNDDVTVYQVEDPNGDLIGAYGVSKEYLVLATSGESVETLFAGEANLADSDKYKNVWRAFPRGTIPVMYMDLDGLFAALEDLDPTIKDAADVNPVYAFAMGTNSDKNITQTTMIFFVAGE